MYDPKLLKLNFSNLFGQDLDNFLSDENFIKALYEKSYSALTAKCSYDGKNELKLKILENYFLYLSSQSKLNPKEQKHLDFLKKFYFKLFISHPIIFFKSSLYKYPDLIFPEIPESIYNELENLKNTATKNAKKYLRKDNLSQSDINFLLLFYKDRKNSKTKEKIITYIINNFKECSLPEKSFLLETIGKEINLENPAYLCITDALSTSDINFFLPRSCLIGINPEFLKKDVVTVLYKLITQIKHSIDIKVPLSMEFSSNSFSTLNALLPGESDDEYNLASQKFAIEKLDTIFSKYDAQNNLLSKVSRENKKLSKKEPIKRISKPYENIVTSVRNNPYLLNEYPELKLIFNPDGTLKDISELVKLYTLLVSNLEKIMASTPIKELTPIMYFIDHELLSRKKVPLTGQSKEYLHTFFDIIICLINKRCSEIEDLIKMIINNPRKKEEISSLIESYFIIIDEYLKTLNYYRLNQKGDSYINNGFISLEATILKTKDDYSYILRCSTLRLLTLK